MSAFVRMSPILGKAGGKLFFDCLGCEMLHDVNVEVDGPSHWSWNSSVDKPTFHPSVLCCYPWRPLENGEHEWVVRHFFITDGRIQFLSDCTHHLVGQAVDLPQLGDDE